MANYISKDQARSKLIECADVRRVKMMRTNTAAINTAPIDTAEISTTRISTTRISTEGRNGR
ncbi:hypothetical protein ACVBEQ_20075 [Nakamurella sp. GG22]